MQEFQAYYDTLKVPRTATLAEIKQAFRRLARQYHPDLNPNNPEAEALFKKVCEAYEMLQTQVYDDHSGSSHWTDEEGRHSLDFYVAGVQHLLDQDYLTARQHFTEAIAQQPAFLPAYLKRCQTNLHLGNYRAVLQDCQQILTLDADCAEAYYYRGRARYRLGYIQSAIDAYDGAIARQSAYAAAYYHRGIAYLDLKQKTQALQDLQLAAQYFRAQQDTSGYNLAQNTLNSLLRGKPRAGGAIAARVFPALKIALRAFPWILINPETQLPATFQHLQRYRIGGLTGFLMVIAALALVTLGAALGWEAVVPLSPLQVAIAASLVAVSLVGVSAIARWAFDRRTSTWGGDWFVVGTALMPVGMLPLLGTLFLGLGPWSLLAIALVALWYSGLLLYLGLTQVQSIPSGYAAMLVPLAILLSSGVARLVWLLR
jgi:tetratricopeptide (TPR) repeat protein